MLWVLWEGRPEAGLDRRGARVYDETGAAREFSGWWRRHSGLRPRRAWPCSRGGGNAFDAAVAAGLTLQVVEPHLNGLGGEVPILLYDERRGEVMSYALHYAEQGYPVLPQIAAAIASIERQFRDHWSSSAETYLTGDGPPAAGSRWRNPVLARTYHRLLSESESATADREGQIEAARRVFFEGFVAEAMLDFMATEVMDSSVEAHAGVMGR